MKYNFVSLQIIYIILIIYLIILKQISENKYEKKTNELIKELVKSNENKNKNLSEKINLLRLMTNNNKFEYEGIQKCLMNDSDRQFCIYHLISPKSVLNKKKILLGGKRDGSYVILDDFSNIKIAYSFGIGKKVQFDKELADRGIDVYMYDHTINSLPFENKKFHWKKIGISGVNSMNNTLKKLESIIVDNGHANEDNMILKIDIEHNEWEALNEVKEGILEHFKYIIMEYHFKDEKDFDNKNIYYNVLKKIHSTHQVFYLTCNGRHLKKANFGNNRICRNLEVSYIIKKGNIFIKDTTIYPMYEFEFSGPKLDKLEENLNILKLFDD